MIVELEHEVMSELEIQKIHEAEIILEFEREIQTFHELEVILEFEMKHELEI